jgi:D-sedoheptulose 7-phosphate isomerase
MTSPTDLIRRHFERSRDTVAAALEDNAFIKSIEDIAAVIERSLRNGGKVLLAGNGGSAADAQHIAAEFISRLLFDRAPLAAIALTTDTSALTAIGNDYGFEQVFSRQVKGLAKRDDVLIAISTSGKSPNVLKAVEAAKEMGVLTIAFTGNADAPLTGMCDLVLRAPTPSTMFIQQIHITAAHSICELVEAAMFGNTPGQNRGPNLRA